MNIKNTLWSSWLMGLGPLCPIGDSPYRARLVNPIPPVNICNLGLRPDYRGTIFFYQKKQILRLSSDVAATHSDNHRRSTHKSPKTDHTIASFVWVRVRNRLSCRFSRGMIRSQMLSWVPPLS